ncbi:MAG: thiamine monophosphate synthase [Hyphomicrobiales bacterium]|nr:thiamine monophosphate synthase [Hyphomicrobiales bacterium]
MSADSPQLYLFTPPIESADAFAPRLEEALAAAPVACVYLDLAGLSEGDAAKAATRLVPIVQKAGGAALVAEARVAARSKADGVHIVGRGEALAQAIDEAVESMKPDRIVGAGGLRSRHDSMAAGETEVDYVMFGDPAPDGWTPPLGDVVERVSWWAEIFNVPCVGYAPSLPDVALIVGAGADFVALRDAVWGDPRGPAAALQEAADLIHAAMRAGEKNT